MKTIRVKILLFAALADRLGVREVELSLPFKSTAGDALDVLAERFPEVAAWRDRLALAVNLEYVQPATLLADADEVALIPPVSGG